MSKKSVLGYLGLLILSVVVTYLLPIVKALMNLGNSSGDLGIPFNYGTSSFFGGSSFDNLMFTVDVIFWFVIILIFWKFIRKLLKKS